MQAWNQVKVKDEASEHHGRAGLVESFDAATGVNVVKLDETDTHLEGHEEFTDDQLTLLGN